MFQGQSKYTDLEHLEHSLLCGIETNKIIEPAPSVVARYSRSRGSWRDEWLRREESPSKGVGFLMEVMKAPPPGPNREGHSIQYTQLWEGVQSPLRHVKQASLVCER